ncbi:MAG: phosphatase PAP2 family protein [Chloroflexi bacterium]|nr:phosphatase PAP2 family protein [Chloroflexota bacterium]
MDIPDNSQDKLWAERLWNLIKVPLFWGLLISIGVLYAFSELAGEILEGESLAFDAGIISFVRSFASESLTRLMIFVTTFGDWRFMLFITLILAFLWWQRGWWDRIIILVTTTGGAYLLDTLLKLFFQRARPDITGRLIAEQGYSFPSGHAMSSLCFYGIIVFLLAYGKPGTLRWAGPLIGGFLILMIGLSRVYLGVHYPSDVLGGYLAGAVWLNANIFAFNHYHRTPRTTPSP